MTSNKTSRSSLLGRVSITFDAGPDSSVSRDFPGRRYDNKEKKLLQEWSKEFRRGIPCHQNTDDKRTVPNKTSNHRRKPFIGSSILTRHCAYVWFRQTQKRLVDKAIVKLTNATATTGSSNQGKGRNRKGKGNIKGTRQLSLEKQLCACPIRCLVPNVYDKASSLFSTMTPHSPFIEVEWCTNHTMEFQEQVRAQYRTHIGIKSTGTGTATMQLHPVYLLSNGNGGYFQATDLPVGTFSVNGVQFTVIDTSTGPSNTKKAKKRSRKKQQPTAEVPATATTIQTNSTCMQTNAQEKTATTAVTMNRPRKKEKRAQHNQHMSDWPVAPSFSFSSSHASSSSIDSMLPVVGLVEPQLCRVKSFTPQVFILDEPTGEQYVTVEWLKTNDRIAPPRYTTIGMTTVELFPVANGQSVFRASNLKVGNYVVDGVSFSVIRTPFPNLIGGVQHV